MVKYVKVDEEFEIPSDVTLTMTENRLITVKGKQGSITKDFNHIKTVDIKVMNKVVYLHADFPRKKDIALVNTIKNLVNNMFLGVREGYTYKMKIVYSHFPITVEAPKKGDNVILIKNFIGERAPRVTYSIGDVTVKTNKEEVVISGLDKESVGQTAANIQKRCKIKNKDKRVFQDGVYVYEKLLGTTQFWVIK